jgi:hypothetical protein
MICWALRWTRDVVHFDGAVHDVSSSIGSVNFICLNSKEAIWGMV